MGWIKDETGRAVGGGIPLDETGATGFGIAAAIDVGARHVGLTLSGRHSGVRFGRQARGSLLV
jgi:glutamate dehydrogenase (NAD(P)+)